MLLIDNEDVRQLVKAADCIEVQEKAFAELRSGRATHRPRIDVYAPAETEDSFYRWSSMEGVTVFPGPYFATRMKSDVVAWPASPDGHAREQKYCGRPGLYCGLIFLFSTRTGMPLALINDGVLQHLRVGAGAALGVKHLARPDANTVGVLGSGGMARSYLQAIAAVRALERAKVFSPTRANAENFAAEMSDELGIPVQVTDSARQAVADSDIVATCTDSMSPVLHPDWLEPGMHVVNVSPTEIDASCYARFDVVFRQGQAGISISDTKSARVMREVGQSPIAYVAGSETEVARLPKSAPTRVGFGGDFPHIDELIHGTREGRTSSQQVTFYHNFGNQGLQFACVGALVYERARAAGRGRELPDSWFLQDIRN